MIQPIKLCARCGHGFFPQDGEAICNTCVDGLYAMASKRARLRYITIAGLTLVGGILWLIFR